MLSAIAARKAAQAASGAPAVSAPPPKPVSRPPEVPLPASPAPATPNNSRPNSKRKPSSQGPDASRKRKKKREVEQKKARYFEQVDPFKNGDGIVVIDSDEDEDEELESELDEVQLPPAPPPPRSKQRAWSPSAPPLNDSSDEEEQDGAYPASPPETQPLTTFRVVPNKNTVWLQPAEIAALGLSSDTATVLGLSAGETVGLLGTYTFTVLRGAVSIFGVCMPAEARAHNVFAPRSSPIPILEALNDEPSSFNDAPACLRPLYENYGTLVVIQPLNTGVEELGKICRTFEGVFKPSRWQQINAADDELRIPGVYMLTQPNRDIQPFTLPPTWEAALGSVSESSTGVYLIKGHKKSGKSTFARTLLNRLLLRYRRVAFLECDLGQSEFTPAGMVALNIIDTPVFGPPFSHPTLPNFAHYTGMTTPKSSPSQYLAAIQAIVETYQMDVQSPADTSMDEDPRISDTVPLIVNTMGWTKGLGADLARRIEEITQPSEIFQVEAPFSDEHPLENPNTKVHLLRPIISTTNFSPSDHRSIAILSYFHAIFPPQTKGIEQVTAVGWNTALPLCAHPPYEVDWSSALDKVVLCGAGSEDVVPSEVNRVLNGALVGLVSCEAGSLESDMNGSGHGMPYTQGFMPPSPSNSVCRGLALIRAVSPSSPHIHVLTPLPPHLLADCRVLVKGELELPVWGMLDFRAENDNEVAGVERSSVPYLQWGKGEGLGGERRRVRRNLMRKGQM
ncbi:hypothetical protein FB45DRAFT_896891 [Roridomyces roridus]|uniref:Polynucleotide 5'-hydroxyl-kinase GRC3 n=1 Tax=Roridomyces roridus TaxID=1738132 RepID=A0AAD7CB68_9AGAR|nr:hypothetical protein FB45DRAFT_896891 [Roridomyces roridus]